MTFVQAALISSLPTYGSWRNDWAWGVPLIVVTMVIHVLGLGLIHQKTSHLSSGIIERRHPTTVFVVVMGASTMYATCLHGLEALLWACAYRFLEALPDIRSAILYSLGAITSYGHANLELGVQWQLMGALEALNGWLLFGLTTAFLFGMLDKMRLSNLRVAERSPQPTRSSLSMTGT